MDTNVITKSIKSESFVFIMKSIQDRLNLIEMIYSYFMTQCIHVAAKFKIADILEEGPKTYQQISQEINCNPEALLRMMRFINKVGLFKEVQEGRFANNDLSKWLKSDVKGSLRPLALCHGTNLLWKSWEHFDYSIKTGKSACEYCFDMSFFEYLSKNNEISNIFDEGMSNLSLLETETICDYYDFSQFKQIVDVGGGRGQLLLEILKNHPELKGILFDQEHVLEQVNPHFKEKEMLERSSIHSGDFFEQIPMGGDAYLLKHILHDWDDDKALKILQNCRRAMKDDSKILVIELLMETDNVSSLVKMRDLSMLVLLQEGKERTEKEYRYLYRQAGFQLTQVITLPSGVSIIEGIPD